jgi:CheY-like chemotaxis protein
MNDNAATILIVDDDADIRDLMKTLLELDGYHVKLAADGLDAFKQLQAGAPPALILLDLMMPRMDGEQFLKEIRVSRFAKIPVVVMSGHCPARKTAGELDAADYLMKPIELDDLLKTIRRFAMPHPSRDAA